MKVGGGVVGAVFITPNVINAINNPTPGNTTRAIFQGAAVGTAFIPVVGIGISLTLSAIDFWWGPQIYNWMDNNYHNTMHLYNIHLQNPHFRRHHR